MKNILLLLPVLLAATLLHAQPCTYFPADCPDKDYVNIDRASDSIDKLNNPVVPQEITMEYNLRTLTASIMQRMAVQQHWDVVELTESGSSGYRTPDGAVVEYGKRPPHSFSITWQCIVNKDSLQQWDAWLKAFGQRRLQEMGQYASRQQSQQGAQQAYMDSANHYGDLKAKYMTDHAQQYQQAVLSGNKVVLDAWQKETDRYDKKINFFVGKAAGTQQDAQAEKENSDGDAERIRNTILFHDGAVVLVQFDFNYTIAETTGMPLAGSEKLPTAAVLHRYNNAAPVWNDPIRSFARSKNIALLLLGAWNAKPDGNNYYHAAFAADKGVTGITSLKRIKCDLVQTIDVYVSGNKKGVRQCLEGINWDKLNGMLVR